MIEEVKMYAVFCDRCGKQFIDTCTGFGAWVDKETAREYACDEDWVHIGDKIYCPDCYEIDEETDEYVLKNKED